MQANEILKKILNIGQNLNGFILILDLLNLSIRRVKLKKFPYGFVYYFSAQSVLQMKYLYL